MKVVRLDDAGSPVGVYSVQLAHLYGARVTATASTANAAFVRELGAERVIDYRSERFEDSVTQMDVVFDTVGGETLQQSWGVLKADGRLITIASSEEGHSDARTRAAFFIVEPNHKQLSVIADLLQSGKLRAVVDSVLPLTQAPEAYEGKARRGKVVITMD